VGGWSETSTATHVPKGPGLIAPGGAGRLISNFKVLFFERTPLESPRRGQNLPLGGLSPGEILASGTLADSLPEVR
jgi:hypothetical protein